VFRARAHDHHRLRAGAHDDQRAVLGDQHVAAAHHAAARQEDAERAARRVDRVEAALLAHVPVELDRRGAPQQHRAESAPLRQELARRQHRVDVAQNRK
jgi:hypothetical protein